jgi:F0F1-type ATP synthase assembly protein I
MAQGDRGAWEQMGRMGSFGLMTGIAMLICGGLGILLDRYLGTPPIFTAIFFLGGGASAFWYGIVNILK